MEPDDSQKFEEKRKRNSEYQRKYRERLEEESEQNGNKMPQSESNIKSSSAPFVSYDSMPELNVMEPSDSQQLKEKRKRHAESQRKYSARLKEKQLALRTEPKEKQIMSQNEFAVEESSSPSVSQATKPELNETEPDDIQPLVEKRKRQAEYQRNYRARLKEKQLALRTEPKEKQIMSQNEFAVENSSSPFVSKNTKQVLHETEPDDMQPLVEKRKRKAATTKANNQNERSLQPAVVPPSNSRNNSKLTLNTASIQVSPQKNCTPKQPVKKNIILEVRVEKRRTSEEAHEDKQRDRTRNVSRRLFHQNDYESLLHEFKTKIIQAPIWICCCCGGLFYQESTKVFTEDQLTRRGCSEEQICSIMYLTARSNRLCTTCYKYVIQREEPEVPRLALCNGFYFPVIPEVLKNLTPLEERLVSPRFPFMQLRALGCDRQLSS